MILFAEAVLQALTISQLPTVSAQERGPRTRNHDQQLHQMIVNIGRGGGLNDEHILIANRRVNLNACLEREEL